MAINPDIQNLRMEMFALNENWRAGRIPEKEFREELLNLDQRVTELATRMPNENLTGDKAFIDKLKTKINWADMGYQTQAVNGFFGTIAAIVKKIFG